MQSMKDQEDTAEEFPVIAAASPPATTLIVGCEGRMGKMLMDRGCQNGLDIRGIDIPFLPQKLEKACAGSELVVLCVPARHLGETLQKIVPYLEPACILCDITSVKETPMRQMDEAWSGAVVGTHPLFGPKNDPADDLPVVIVRGKKATGGNVATVAAFFRAMGCRCFESTATKHDQAMARIQNMNFITNLAYFAVMAEQKDLLPFLTPSFERRKNAAAKMLNEDAEMFAGLFEANGHSHEAVRQYRRILNLAAGGDIELLCNRAQWWWRDSG